MDLDNWEQKSVKHTNTEYVYKIVEIMNSYYLSLTFLLLFGIHSIQSYQCYYCLNGPSCQDPFKVTKYGTGTLEAPEGYVCAKAKLDGVVTERGPIPVSYCQYGNNKCKSGNGATICCCDSDLCNNSPSLKYQTGLAVISAAVIVTALLNYVYQH